MEIHFFRWPLCFNISFSHQIWSFLLHQETKENSRCSKRGEGRNHSFPVNLIALCFFFVSRILNPLALFLQVSANTENSSMSGYLNRSKGNKKQWKRLWFVVKNKVLYTYAASEVLVPFSSLFPEHFALQPFWHLAGYLFLPPGCCSAGESASAGFFPERGEERSGSEAPVQTVPQKHVVLHL